MNKITNRKMNDPQIQQNKQDSTELYRIKQDKKGLNRTEHA